MSAEVADLGNDIRRIRAPNASPMTFTGTNSYILGRGEVCLVDPGPDDGSHIEAILSALAPGERIAAILVTHSHVDHSLGAPLLAARTGAPVLAYGDSLAGRSAHMQALAGLGGGEGVDHDFRPDRELGDGEAIRLGHVELRAHWTPGHFGNHLCFEYRGALLTGDLVMGWASSMVSPPDGDLTAFMASLERIGELGSDRFLPGHGEPVEDAAARLNWLVSHRQERERQIVAALLSGPGDATELTARVYTDVEPRLLPAARRNMLAHLIDLHQKSAVTATPGIGENATWALI